MAPAGAFPVERAISLHRGAQVATAVLTKFADQGPGYDIFEYVAVE